MKNTKSNLLGGALVGAVLGVAAGMLLAPKSGKKLRKDIGGRVADFHKYISPKIKLLKNMSEAQYKAFMKTAIGGYSKAKKLSAEEAKELAGYAQEFWKHLKRHF
ncbi:MAG: YtxH domain-containing protein [Patescibacteria group bacterium]